MSLAARAKGKEEAEGLASDLTKEVASLREQLSAAVESAKEMGSKAGAAEDETSAMAGKLSGLEKVVRRLGGEAEVCKEGRVGVGERGGETVRVLCLTCVCVFLCLYRCGCMYVHVYVDVYGHGIR